MTSPTKAQVDGLRWLAERNGDGVFNRNQVLIAAGEKAPVVRATWNRLADLGLVEFYADRRRVRVTDAGRKASA